MVKAKRAKGRPKVADSKALAEIVAVRMDADTAQRLDKWRSEQDAPPTRSQAIRALTRSALQTRGY
jgi:metal-responsive CopG/Arc/MetJ family transcriptional regulator